MCQHPNISRLMDVYENSSNHYLVLEYIGGKNLYDYLRDRTFRVSEFRAREIIY